MAQRITYTTDDGVIIAGEWTVAPTMIGAAVLIHMMPATRSSWTLLEGALSKRGIGSLAIDLRGHGESVETNDGTKIDYRKFSDDEHQSSVFDVAGAVEWIRKRGIDVSRIVLIGASVGANLAVRELASEPRLRGAVLLSPGEAYNGMNVREDAQNLLPDQGVFITSSEDDMESYAASRALYDEAPVTLKTFVPYKKSGHGTNMFSTDPALTEKIAEWLLEAIRG